MTTVIGTTQWVLLLVFLAICVSHRHDDNDEVPHSGASAWGEPVDYGNGDDEESVGRFREEEFPAVGSQPVRKPGQGRDYGRGSSERGARSGGYSERDDARPGRGDRDDREDGRARPSGRDRRDEDRGDYYDGRSGDRPNRRERGYEERDTHGGSRGSYNNNREGRDRDRGFTREREERAPVPFPTSPPWTAHVGNLPYDVRKDELAKFFEDNNCRVDQIRLLTDKEGRLRGYGYVEFLDEESLRLALECHDQDFSGRAIRVGIAERRKDAGFTSRRDSREGYSRRDNNDADETKTWRSQRLAHAPVSDPLHEEQGKKADEHPSPQPVAKPKFNPFGDAKPRDEREVERKVTELQKQKEEEEKKRREEERRKREEEALKKKQEKEIPRQKEAGHQGDQKSATSWRAEKNLDGKPSGWANNKKRNDTGRGTEGRRDPKKAPGVPRNPGRKPDPAGRGDRKVTPGGRGRGKPQTATEAKEKVSSPPAEQKEPKKQMSREDRPKTEAKATNAPSAAPALENDNAFALLREDEEA